jgi:ABC-2 type transport system ATP-binding protein
MYDIDKEIYKHRIFSFLDLFGLKNEVRTPMHAFSKGMRQKVLLVSSLIHNPEIIFWDEPLNGIDYSTAMVVRSLVKEMSAAGKTFFYSTHQVESVDKICTKMIVLNSGKIVYDGSLSALNGETVEDIMKRYAVPGGESDKMQGLYSNHPAE